MQQPQLGQLETRQSRAHGVSTGENNGTGCLIPLARKASKI